MTLPGYQTYAPPAPPGRGGLAKASLVLGIVGLFGLVLCLAGVVPALVGLVLGVVSLARGDARRGMAAAGVICSAVAVLAGGAVAFWLLHKAAQCGDEARYPNDDARQHCVEREFPFAQASETP